MVQQMFTLTSAPLCLHKVISQERMPAKVFVHVWVQSYREEARKRKGRDEEIYRMGSVGDKKCQKVFVFFSKTFQK